MPSIEIPVGNEEVLEIDLDDLEGYDDTILKILLDEKVDLKFFVQFAVRFFVLLPECAT
jgi:hypothetical protein